MAKSILQSQKECFVCRRWYNVKTVRGLEEHHVLTGPLRSFAEQQGLMVWLCHRPHNQPGFSAHFDPALAQQLKCYAQQRFEETYTSGVPAHTVWMLHTGKDYTHA